MDSARAIQMQCVVLRHDEGAGRIHFDWMLARENPPETGLETYRVDARPDAALTGDVLSLTPLGDHRLKYLSYEGPLSEHRGAVQRVASGICVRLGSSVFIQWNGSRDVTGWQHWTFTDTVATLSGTTTLPLATES